MLLADISLPVALLSTAFVLACAVTCIVLLVGLIFTARRSTRTKGQSLLFLTLCLIAFDLVLLVSALALERRFDERFKDVARTPKRVEQNRRPAWQFPTGSGNFNMCRACLSALPAAVAHPYRSA
jgi:hypothetical protein